MKAWRLHNMKYSKSNRGFMLNTVTERRAHFQPEAKVPSGLLMGLLVKVGLYTT